MSNDLAKKEKKFIVNFMIYIVMFLVVLGLSVVINETNELSIYSTGFLAMSPVVPIIFLLRFVVSHFRFIG